MIVNCVRCIAFYLILASTILTGDEPCVSNDLVRRLEKDGWFLTLGNVNLDEFDLDIVVHNRHVSNELITSIKAQQSKNKSFDNAVASRLHHVHVILDFTGRLDDGFVGAVSQKAPLRILIAPASKITDDGVASLSLFEGIEVLDLYKCDISDEAIESLAKLKYLRVLCVAKTKISDGKLDELKRRLPFCRFADELRW